MSTRARIFVRQPDYSYKSVYVHYDGYPEYVGRILHQHYNSEEKANGLVDLGDISTLNPTIDTTEAYHRDRGEDLNFEIVEERPEPNSVYEDYGYIFEDGKWWTNATGQWTLVDDIVNK